MNRKLVIMGAGEFGQIAYEYFNSDSEYDVVAFAVEKQYREREELFGIPIINFEECRLTYPPEECDIFVAITFVQLNRVRGRIFEQCKLLGYNCASYISSHAFVGDNVSIGENTFIFENTIIQHRATIGNNVVIWSGSNISHRSKVEDNCWLAPRCCIAGLCTIKKNCFIGANATVGDNVTIDEDIVLGAGAVAVTSLSEKGRIYVGVPARLIERSSYEKFGLISSQEDDRMEEIL